MGEYYEKQDGCCSGIGAHSFVVVLAHGSVVQFDTPAQKASRAESLKLGSRSTAHVAVSSRPSGLRCVI